MKRSGNRTGLAGSRLGSGVLGLAALSVATVFVLPAAWADDAAQAVSAARLSSVEGQVQVSQGNQVLADQAVANMPLFEETRVATADNGRAEIQFEDGSVARLSPNSSLTLTVLRGQGGVGDAEIVLETGLGYFEVQGAGQAGQPGQGGSIRIRFGDSVVTAGGFSVFRINLDNPPGELAVFSGNAHLERGSGLAVDLHGGESLALNGADATKYELNESIEPDSWDTWNSDRDQMLTSEASSKTGATKGFADSSNPAWNDLDANGNWYDVPGQGNIWSPYAASGSGWDPYGSGDWMWTPRFGYSWVSGYSWGYLPYQCGNWNYYASFGWGWAPGLGGCAPWWGGGYHGPNIGFGYAGYLPPVRPHPRPIRPIGRRGLVEANPIVAVNRRPSNGSSGMPARNRSGTVVIAGHTVQAFRPLSPRPQYERSASGFVNRAGGTSAGARTTTATEPSFGGIRQGSSVNSPGARTPARTSVGSGSGSRASTARPAASGGGSPAGHSSSGGGFSGGGGGASHGGGGGGSHR